MSASVPADIAILTIIPPELAALREALDGRSTAEKIPATGTNIWRGTIRCTRDDTDYTVVTTCVGYAGNIDCVSAVSELHYEFSPRILVLTGIAGGMRSKTKIGEVVISERVVGYEGGAVTTSGFEPRPEITRLVHSVQQDATLYVSENGAMALPDGWMPEPRMKKKWKKTRRKQAKKDYRESVATELTARMSTLASGEKLLRNASAFRILRELHGKIEAAEMEAAGVASFCSRVGLPWIVFRGISDFGDEFKDDRFHKFAARTAAHVAVDFLRRGASLAHLSPVKVPARRAEPDEFSPPAFPPGWHSFYAVSGLDQRRHTQFLTLAAMPHKEVARTIDGRLSEDLASAVAAEFGHPVAQLTHGSARSDLVEIALCTSTESFHWFRHQSGTVGFSIGLGDLSEIDLWKLLEQSIHFVRLCEQLRVSTPFELYLDFQPGRMRCASVRSGITLAGMPAEVFARDIEFRHVSDPVKDDELRDPRQVVTTLLVDRWRVMFDLPHLVADPVASQLPAPSTSTAVPTATTPSVTDRIGGYYLSTASEWVSRIRLREWAHWTGGLIDVYPTLSASAYTALHEAAAWLMARAWPEGFSNVRDALENFRRVLLDFLQVFDEHSESAPGDVWRIPQFYRIPGWDPATYHRLGQEWQYHTDLVADLLLELTRAANLVLSRARQTLDPLFAADVGAAQVRGAPNIDFARAVMQPRYSDDQGGLPRPYPGLERFRIERASRDIAFGAGKDADDPEFQSNLEERQRRDWDEDDPGGS